MITLQKYIKIKLPKKNPTGTYYSKKFGPYEIEK